MTEAARPAAPGDEARLLALHRSATDELRDQRGGRVWADHTDRDAFRAFDLADASQLVLVGTLDDSVVGYARIRREPLPSGASLAVLTDLYVEPQARQVGVGEALLDSCVAWAVAQGCAGIDSVALPGMRESKNFFETAGLVARAIVVHRPLP